MTAKTESINKTDQRDPKSLIIETRRGFISDLIERDLQSNFDELFFLIIQLADGELMADEELFARSIKRLSDEASELNDRLNEQFPVSRSGGAASYLKRTCRTLLDEVNVYRAEQFWTHSDTASRVMSEELIRDLFRFYDAVDLLMREIDQVQPDYRIERRIGAPKLPANPYEEIVSR